MSWNNAPMLNSLLFIVNYVNSSKEQPFSCIIVDVLAAAAAFFWRTIHQVWLWQTVSLFFKLFRPVDFQTNCLHFIFATECHLLKLVQFHWLGAKCRMLECTNLNSNWARFRIIDHELEVLIPVRLLSLVLDWALLRVLSDGDACKHTAHCIRLLTRLGACHNVTMSVSNLYTATSWSISKYTCKSSL